MLFGFSAFTWVHTLLSLVAILTGFVVLWGLIASRPSPLWTAIYLLTTVATSVTGFGFPFTSFGPSHWVGVLSLVVLVPALLGLYLFHLRGAWRWIYAAAFTVSLYFLVFVLVAQLFQKVPALNALAPTTSEPPFLIAQAIVLVLFVLLGVVAALRFRPMPAIATPFRGRATAS